MTTAFHSRDIVGRRGEEKICVCQQLFRRTFNYLRSKTIVSPASWMLDTSMLDAETGGATTGYSYSGQYGVRRASTRPDVYRTQFGSMTADEYITPMLQAPQRTDNVARRLSRNSFLIPPQTFKRRHTDGTWINGWEIASAMINRFVVMRYLALYTFEYHASKTIYLKTDNLVGLRMIFARFSHVA